MADRQTFSSFEKKDPNEEQPVVQEPEEQEDDKEVPEPAPEDDEEEQEEDPRPKPFGDRLAGLPRPPDKQDIENAPLPEPSEDEVLDEELNDLVKPLKAIADQLEATAVSFKTRNPDIAEMNKFFYNKYNHLVAMAKLGRRDRFIQAFKELGPDGEQFIDNVGLDEDSVKELKTDLKALGLLGDEDDKAKKPVE